MNWKRAADFCREAFENVEIVEIEIVFNCVIPDKSSWLLPPMMAVVTKLSTCIEGLSIYRVI